MAPKPFGKTGLKRWSIPRAARISLWILGVSPAAWLVAYPLSRRYPVIDDGPVVFATIGFFAVLFSAAAVQAFRRRPIPRAPGEGGFSRWAGPLLLGLVVGIPPAFGAALLYEPVELAINGALGRSSGRKAWAMVEQRDGRPALVSPYWRDDAVLRPPGLAATPAQKGDTATLDLGDGFLGMTWIRDVSIEELR